ncbi:MAG: beta-galactosidase trimerization domain-containing protein [Planctomycetaceae bacterium]
MSQPFDERPFHTVNIPKWVEETVGCGYTLSVMDTAARERAVAHGVTISEMGFVDPFYAYYDSKLLKRRNPNVPLDRLPQDIAEYNKLGLRILAVYPPSLQGEVYELHPDWRRIPTNTREIPQINMQKYPHGGMLCLLGPYGDFFIDVLCEILTTFPDVDAFSFDGLHYGGVCYCEHCRKSFLAATGEEIPDADMNLPLFRRYQHWADRRMEDVIRRAQERLKTIKPDVALVTWTTNAGRFGHFLSIPRNMPARMNLLLDAPDQEFWLDESNRGATIVPAFANAYIWATTNHRVAFSEPYLMTHGNPYGKDSFPPAEVLRRMLLAVTYGAAPSIAVIQPPNMQPAIYEGLDELQRRRPWLTHKSPEPWAALVMSDNTRNFYGRSAGEVEQRYMANVFGTFRTAIEEHLPMTIVNDWNLNSHDLSKYKVLVLPNTACLDQRQVSAIEAFVRLGGGLVASLDTSLFDEFGNPHENFSLAEVLGVDYRGIPDDTVDQKEIDVNFAISAGLDYWEKRKNIFDLRIDQASWVSDEKLKTYVGDNPVTFKGPAIRVKPRRGRQVVGTLQTRSDAAGSTFPAIVSGTYGKGRVVYLPAGFDASYYLYSYPYQRLLLKQSVKWAASQPSPVDIVAPMCVHSTLMRQKNESGERLLVHLFNDLNTTAFHALPNDDVPLREETVPLFNLKLTFGKQYQFQRVHLEPEGIDLPMQQSEQGTTVVVPQLDIHSIVVGEFEPAKSGENK